jgi:8-oxo-dGTP pyrophosphatase MutT (NUDIX family)
MTLKKKHWIILIVIAVAIAIGLTLYFLLRPTAYYPESIDPRTLHASPANNEMLVGLWQKDGHVFYRFEPDGKGHTWDVDDDIAEDEASPFNWEAFDGAIMMTYKLRIRGIVPRYYELDQLSSFDLRFHDSYSSYALERVEEQMALEGKSELK